MEAAICWLCQSHSPLTLLPVEDRAVAAVLRSAYRQTKHHSAPLTFFIFFLLSTYHADN